MPTFTQKSEECELAASLPDLPGLVLDLCLCFKVFVFHFQEYVRRLV